jgi:chromosome partitioning protein
MNMDPKMSCVDAANFLKISLPAIHKRLKSKKLPYSQNGRRAYFGNTTARQLLGLQFTQKNIAFQIVKGGTGKTSLAVSIAIRANLYGARVLCVDLDQQSNMTQTFHKHNESNPCMLDVINGEVSPKDIITNIVPGLDLIPSRMDNALLDNTIMLKRLPLDRVYRDIFDEVRPDYDIIIFDCPPAIGQSVAAVTLASDVVAAPVTPENYALSGLQLTAHEVGHISETYGKAVELRIIVNKYDNRTALSHAMLSTIASSPTFGKLLYKSYVRRSQEFANAIARGDNIFENLQKNPAKEDIDILTREILEIDETVAEQPSVILGSLSEQANIAAAEAEV